MDELRVSCGPDDVPPGSWIAGETVSFRGGWWFIKEMHRDTQGSSGTHFHLVRAARKETGVGNFSESDDPRWAEGEVVEQNGKRFRVSEVRRTAARVGYYGVLEPPEDPPELAQLFG